MEGLGNPRLADVLALDDSLVCLHPADGVVGFQRKHLLQVVRGAVRLQRPHLHLPEALPPELRLAAKRLLRDERVRPRGARVYLVFHKVDELHHVDEPHRYGLVERLARAPVVQHRLAQRRRGYLLFAVKAARLFLHVVNRHLRHVAPHVFPQPSLQADAARVPGDRVVPEHIVVAEAAALHPLPRLVHIDALDPAGVYRRGVDRPRLVQDPRLRQRVLDAHVRRAVEHRRHRLEPEIVRRPAQMRLQHLPQVHPRRHPDGVQDDVHRRPVGQKRHILFGQDLGDHALVAVPPRHLVPFGYLARLRYPYAHHLVHARRKLVPVVAAQHLDVDHLAPFPVRHAQRSVLDVPRLLPEYRAQKLFFGAKLRLPLRRYLTHQNVARLDLRPHADDAVFVQVAQAVFPHIRYVARDLFGPQLGVPRLYLVLFYVDGSELVLFHELAAKDDGVLEVVAFPAHERDQRVLPQRQVPVLRRRAVRQYVPLADNIALADDRPLIYAGALVAARELHQPIDAKIVRGFAAIAAAQRVAVFRRAAKPAIKPAAKPVIAAAKAAAVRARAVKSAAVARVVVGIGYLPAVGCPSAVKDFVDCGGDFAAIRRAPVRPAVNHYPIPRRFHNHPVRLGYDHLPAVQRHLPLYPRPHQRRLRPHQRHSLPLHVGPHKRAVRVVMLQERNKRRGHAHELHRRNVHIADVLRRLHSHAFVYPRLQAVFRELPLFVYRRARLRDVNPCLPIRRYVLHRRRVKRNIRLDLYHLLRQRRHAVEIPRVDNPALRQQPLARAVYDVLPQRPPHDVRIRVGDFAADAAVRRLYEPEFVCPRVRRQRPQQPDVRPLRRLYRADAPVMRMMHVPHVEPRPLPRQPARPQRRQPPLVRQLRQRIRLVHELRKLRPAEELPHRSHNRPYVYQRRGRGRRRIHLRGHPLLDDALHPQQPNPHLVLYQLPNRAHAPIAQMVYVVRLLFAVVYQHYHFDERDDVVRLQRPRLGDAPQSAVQLVPPHPPKVVAAVVVEHIVDERPRVLQASRLPRPQAAVKLHQRVFFGHHRRVPQYRRLDVFVVRVVVNVREKLKHLIVRRVAHSPQQRADGRLALAVDLDRYDVAVAGLELHPSPAVGYQLRRRQPPPRVRVRRRAEIHPRRAHKLAHHHPLRPVDDERPVVRHHRYVPNEQRLLLDLPLARPRRLNLQRNRHIQRRGVGYLLFAALFVRVLRRLEVVVAERQLEPRPRRVLYRRNLLEQIPQPGVHEPVERVLLHLYQVRRVHYRPRRGVRALGARAVAVGGDFRNRGCHAVTLLS